MKQLLAATLLVATVALTGCGDKKPAPKAATPAATPENKPAEPAKPADPAKAP